MSTLQVNNIESLDGNIQLPVGGFVPRKGLKELTISHQAQQVLGFYIGTTLGGGVFVYDATKSKVDHNGGTIIAPEAIVAWNGTANNISTLLNWSGSGVGCFVRVGTPTELRLSQFGATDNADNTDILQKVCLLAKTLNLPVVNDVVSVLSAQVYCYTSLQTPKKIICDGMGSIILAHLYAAETVTVTQPTMYRGAAISGVSGYYGGTLKVTSTEKLIDRIGNDEGGQPYYVKEEVAEIVSDSGIISPAWMHTYTDQSKITAVVYPYEEKTYSNIDIEYRNPTLSNFAVLRLNKSNVDLTVKITVNGTKSNANIGLYVVDCVNLTVRPTITSFQSTVGYGVNAFRVSGLTLLDGDVSDCRRPVANRFDKRTRVIRGFYRSNINVSCIDSHWADDIMLDDVHGYCKGLAILDFAGYNATVKNCTLIDALGVIGNRPDTPVAGGAVIIENNNIKQTREVFAFYFSKSVGEDYTGKYDWTLPWPDLIRIKDNIVNITDANWSILRLNDSRVARTQIGHIDVANNTYLNDMHPTGLVHLGCRALDPHTAYTATRSPKITIRNQTFQPGTTYGILDIERGAATWKWDILLEDVFDLYFRLDEDVANTVRLVRGNFIGARVKTFRLSTDAAKTPSFMFDLRGVTITSGCLLYGSANKIMAFDCIFESGALTYSNDSSDQQPLSTNRQTAFAVSMGNVAKLPVTSMGALPPLDGWTNSADMYTRFAIAKHNNGAIGSSDLGPFGIGYRDDTEQLVIVNAAGAVRKIATIA